MVKQELSLSSPNNQSNHEYRRYYAEDRQDWESTGQEEMNRLYEQCKKNREYAELRYI